MQQALIVSVLLVVGVALLAALRTGGYRRPHDHGRVPGHLWVAPAVPSVGVLVTHALQAQPWPVLLPYLLLVPTGTALAAIDADVHRLPNVITLPLVPAQLVLLLGASAATGDWPSLRRAGLATLIVGGGALLLALIIPGRTMGMGDAKLLVSLAPALAWLSWGHLVVGLWLGLLAGSALALVLILAGRATRATRLAFGPFLMAGTLAAVVLA